MNKFEHIDWLWPGSWKMLHWRVLTVPGVFDRSAFWETKGETAATFRETWGEPPWEVGWSTQKPLENLATEIEIILCQWKQQQMPYCCLLWFCAHSLVVCGHCVICCRALWPALSRSLQDLLAFAETEDLKIEPWMRWNPEISWVILLVVREVLGVIVDGC